jgi:N utilization substance protein A
LIPNALQPAEISEVFTYPRLGRAIVLVEEDQLSLAIGRRGQNVRLASKLVEWDIEIMTHSELAESLERAERWFAQLPNVGEAQVQVMIEEGFLSYNELTFIDAAELSEFAGLTPEQSEEVLAYAEEYADHMEQAAVEEREAAEAAAAEEAAKARAEAEAAAAEAAAADAAGTTLEGADATVTDVVVAAEPGHDSPTEPPAASPEGAATDGASV